MCILLTVEIQNLKTGAKHGEYWIETKSGNGYELQIHEKVFLKRVPICDINNVVESPRFKDYEYQEIVSDFNISVGKPAIFILKGLCDLPTIMRVTTAVVTIYDLQDIGEDIYG